MISGTAINLMAVGLPAVILTGLYDNTSNSEPIRNRLPNLGGIDISPLILIALLELVARPLLARLYGAIVFGAWQPLFL